MKYELSKSYINYNLTKKYNYFVKNNYRFLQFVTIQIINKK